MPPTGHLPKCGLKRTDLLPESWGNWPNSLFPLPYTIKQLSAFLWVTGFNRIWIPRYAILSRHLFMILLIFLFGSYIIKALKTVSPPTIKVQTKPVHLRNPLKTHHTRPPHKALPSWAPLKNPEGIWHPHGNNISQWFSWIMPILMPMFLALLFLSFFSCIIPHVCYC
jgi:hypothetical protein